MLTKYKHLVIFPIHPATLANYRKSFRPSGAKGDPNDAGLLLDLLTRHREKLRRITPDTAETRTLRFLVEERRKLVNERIRFSQRLNSHLKLYFPQVLNWFCDIRFADRGRVPRTMAHIGSGAAGQDKNTRTLL